MYNALNNFKQSRTTRSFSQITPDDTLTCSYMYKRIISVSTSCQTDGKLAIKATEEQHSASELIRLRQKKSLQQFASLHSKDVIMKVAFFAVIVAVLSLQGSDALLPLPLPLNLPGLSGLPSIATDPILKPILNATQSIIGQLPPPLGSALPCQLADIVPSITVVCTRAHNFRYLC